MDLTTQQIAIVGCGPGAPEHLTDAARRAVADADVLAGSPRVLELFGGHPGEQLSLDSNIAGLLEAVAARLASGKQVAILVSGDPGVYSLASSVVKRFGRRQCRIVPGVSSVQIAFARLGLDWSGATILSLHASTLPFAPDELPAADKIALLAGRAEAVRWAAAAAEALQASHDAVLCENLTLPDERVRTMDSAELAASDPASLSILLLIRKSLLS